MIAGFLKLSKDRVSEFFRNGADGSPLGLQFLQRFSRLVPVLTVFKLFGLLYQCLFLFEVFFSLSFQFFKDSIFIGIKPFKSSQEMLVYRFGFLLSQSAYVFPLII